ncbi:class I SAM-dependent RNA methyltransferase [Phycicoccus endophyticus]|uniref:class I SAM-dependent RNA methyltransferase n=1 Tax=Phycicoccus endophyticus TaxID=1690220 RepID=UPI0019B662C2|nr:TRAM domain-containing protein [Phycicoccus endophyticus]GGL22908.1 putative RNA methyltransferase [Phycicoccus endophyticus]
MTGERPPGLAVDDEVEVEATAFAHGGHCVARHAGQVLFVRHTVPGERVRARVTEVGAGGRFVRADAVGVLQASPDRVEPPCPWSGPGRCGGCDLQHVSLPAQRRLKAGVVREQLARLAGLDVDVDVEVEAVPGDRAGLGWRTRVEFAVDPGGRAGLRRHRSHEVVPVDVCRIAADGVSALDVPGRPWPGAEVVDAVAPSVGDPVAVAVPGQDPPDVVERVRAAWTAVEGEGRLERDFTVSARGFWQVHPGAASTFLAAAMEELAVRPGERALDLYSGVGLFAAALSEAVGPSGQVVAVEADRDAAARAEAALAGAGNVVVLAARVDDAFGVPRPQRRRGRGRATRASRSPLLPPRADLVVLDPPRTGAGTAVVAAVARLRPRALAYVACDPAALARDTAALEEHGYRLSRLRAFDAFPMTHHVECVAHFVRRPA